MKIENFSYKYLVEESFSLCAKKLLYTLQLSDPSLQKHIPQNNRHLATFLLESHIWHSYVT